MSVNISCALKSFYMMRSCLQYSISFSASTRSRKSIIHSLRISTSRSSAEIPPRTHLLLTASHYPSSSRFLTPHRHFRLGLRVIVEIGLDSLFCHSLGQVESHKLHAVDICAINRIAVCVPSDYLIYILLDSVAIRPFEIANHSLSKEL